MTSKCGMLSAGRNPVPLVNIKIVGFEMNVRSPSNRIARYCEVLFHSHTSSTAQGGGGSFKNRKPIGEIGCCESGMAERIH